MAIAFVQAVSTGRNTTAVTDLAATFAGNITAGNFLVVFATWASVPATDGSGNNAFTDGPGDGFTKVTSSIAIDTPNFQICGFWYLAAGSAGGSATLTMKGGNITNNGGFMGFNAIEFSGLSTTANDQSTGHDSHAGGSASTNGDTAGSFTPGNANSVICAGFIDETGTPGTWTAGTSPNVFTAGATQKQILMQSSMIEYFIQGSAAIINPTATYTNTNGYIASAASFKPATGGGFTAKFRKTLSGVGTGVGKRQHQSSNKQSLIWVPS